MFIRSQDRLSLIPNDKVLIIREFDKNWIARKYNPKDKTLQKEIEYNIVYGLKDANSLGAYASKERALEVLDEIQEAIANSETAHYIYGDYDTNRQYGIISTLKYNIYTMPND
jgi:hypothetical protein